MLRNRNSTEETLLRNFLKEKRLSSGLTQRQLSNIIDGSHSFVNKYESGERFLTFTEVFAICNIIGVDVQELVNLMKELPSIRQK